MNTTLSQELLDRIITIITGARPLVEAVGRKDRDLESQLRRALSSVALNLAEGFGCHAGNARLRFRTALGSLYEARAALRVAGAWGYLDGASANRVVAELDSLGARLFGLARR